MSILSNYLPELQMGLASLFVHKLRSGLTMLGMIFGVGAGVAMLSITSGAQKEMMSYIDLLGVNNIIIEAKESVDRKTGPPCHLARIEFRTSAPSPRTSGHRSLMSANGSALKVLPKTVQEPPLIG
jgi:putative ABC transport system permease protein